MSVSAQLPFFCCKNKLFEKKYQEDISKYLYCKDFNVPPYSGSYGDQPRRWIDKYNVIKEAMFKREEAMHKKEMSKINARQ